MDKPITIVEWNEDHAIDDEGRRWSLSVPWSPDMNGQELPSFLVISAEARKKAWEGVKLTDSHRGGNVEDWQIKVEADRANRLAEKKAKNAKGLAKVKADHPNERYDRKLKQWVPKCDPLLSQ